VEIVDSEMKEKQIKIFILENVKLAVEKWLVKSFLHTGGTNIINLSLGGQQKKKKNLNIWWPMPLFLILFYRLVLRRVHFVYSNYA